MCIRDSLKGVIFLNPLYEYGNSYEPKYLMADEYLSGNVREKLRIAKKSAELLSLIHIFNALGFATSDIAEMGLTEISKTITALNRQNRIIVGQDRNEYLSLIHILNCLL